MYITKPWHEPHRSASMKRKRRANADANPSKRYCSGVENRTLAIGHPINPLLTQYYHEACSLRQYLVSRLPKSSKKRRRRVLHYGQSSNQSSDLPCDSALSELLDTIIVGTSKSVSVGSVTDLDNDISVFTQQVSETDISIAPSSGRLTQSEVGSTQFPSRVF